MQRDVLISVAVGLLSAVLYLSTKWSILGALVLALFTPFPLLAAGLGPGLAAAVIAAATATVTVALTMDSMSTVGFVIGYAVPALMVVRCALLQRTARDGTIEWYPPGHLLVWITLFGIGVFVSTAFLTGSGTNGLREGISSYIDSLRNLIPESRGKSADVEVAFNTLKLIFPFIAVTWWIIVTLVNSVLAQRLVERRGLNRRPGPDLRTITLPPWMAGLMVAVTAAALLGSGWLGFLATNIALILCVPYFLVGLAVLHTVSVPWSGRTAILSVAYLVLLLFSWTAVLVAGIGYLEHWVGVRNRFGGPSRSQERKE